MFMRARRGFCVHGVVETGELAGFSGAQRRENQGKPVKIAHFGMKT
jgi:hypothetical protein